MENTSIIINKTHYNQHLVGGVFLSNTFSQKTENGPVSLGLDIYADVEDGFFSSMFDGGSEYIEGEDIAAIWQDGMGEVFAKVHYQIDPWGRRGRFTQYFITSEEYLGRPSKDVKFLIYLAEGRETSEHWTKIEPEDVLQPAKVALDWAVDTILSCVGQGGNGFE